VTEIALQVFSAKKQEKKDIFMAFLNQKVQSNDEFETYINRASLAVSDDFNPIKWWANTRSPQLINIAFNILLMPAMSSETERAFSGAKLTLSPS
jgi:hAT family C-terminal dimerisation region